LGHNVTKGEVQLLYNLDKESLFELNNTWPRINFYLKKCPGSFFNEHWALFGHAYNDKRFDFWELFINYSTAITLISNYRDTLALDFHPELSHISLLRLCLEQSSVRYLRIILIMWTDLLISPINDLLSMTNHVSNFISIDELLLLAEKFPFEFESFILSLKLVPTHPILSDGVEFAPLGTGEFILAAALNLNEYSGFWKRKYPTLSKDGGGKMVPITSSFIPLQCSSDMRLINAFVTTCEVLESVALFEHDIPMLSIDYAWRTYALQIHLFNLFFHILFMAIFTLAYFSYQKYSKVADDVIQSLALVMGGLYFIQEIRQVHAKTENTSAMLNHVANDIWNAIDFVLLGTLLWGISLRFYNEYDSVTGRCVLSIAMLFSWAKLIYYLGSLESTGPLVSMILHIGYVIRYFLFILLAILLAFTQEFWILFDLSSNDDSQFKNIANGMLMSFQFMIGNYDTSTLELSVQPKFAIFLSVVFVVIVSILLLNLLIALMGDAYNEVKEHSTGHWNFAKAESVIDLSFQLSKQYLTENEIISPKTIFVLKNSTDFFKIKNLNELEELKNEVKKLSAMLQDFMHKKNK